MSDVRLRYPIVVNYLSIIVKVLLLAIASMIIARKLNTFEYSVWGILLSLSMLYITPIALWRFWSIRYIRRGVEEAYTTALALTIGWIVVIIFLHFGVSKFYGILLGGEAEQLLMLGIVYVAVFILYSFELSVISVVFPEYVGYSNILYSVLRFILIVLLVYVVRLGFLGVLLASVFNVIVVTAFIWIKLSKKIAFRKPRFDLVKKWLKMFPIPILSVLGQNIRSLDRLVVPMFSNSELPVAYLTINYAITQPLKMNQSVLSSLYARLLKDYDRSRARRDVEETIKLVSLPLIFISATLIVLGKPILSLMNPKYVDAFPVLIVMVLTVLMNSYFQVYFNSIKAIDTIDLQENVRYGDLFKSNLFQAIFANFARSFLGIIIAMTLLLSYKGDMVFYALAFPLGYAIVLPILLSWIYLKSKKLIGAGFPYKEVVKMVLASIPAILYYYYSGAHTIMVYSFFSDAPILIVHVIVGVILYGVTLLVLSDWTRSLLKASLNVLRKSFNK